MTTSIRPTVRERLAQVFWLGFLAASLAYAWHSFYAPSNDIRWQTDPDVAQALAEAEGKPMVHFVTATWCSPCRIMKREVWADEDVERLVNDAWVPVLVDADAPQSAVTLRRFNISGTPWTILTNAQGDVLGYRAGAMSKPEFLDLLQSVLP
jgi:thioredoxin 1